MLTLPEAFGSFFRSFLNRIFHFVFDSILKCRTIRKWHNTLNFESVLFTTQHRQKTITIVMKNFKTIEHNQSITLFETFLISIKCYFILFCFVLCITHTHTHTHTHSLTHSLIHTWRSDSFYSTYSTLYNKINHLFIDWD
jgi:hypothetical protein